MWSCLGPPKPAERADNGSAVVRPFRSDSETDDTADVWKRLEAEERRCKEEDEREEQEARRRAGETKALRRAEDESKRSLDEARRKVKDTEKAYREEQSRYEQLHRDREMAEHTLTSLRAECARLAEERKRWKERWQEREVEIRKTAVAVFLQDHGFANVSCPKRTMMKTTYPLHVAATSRNLRIVKMLLDEGANPSQKDSSGKTALQACISKDKDGSHREVIEALETADPVRVASYRNAVAGA